MKWLKIMRQVRLTSLGDDVREILTIAGLEKAKERSLEQHLRLRAPQTWVVLCASVDQYLRTTVGSIAAQSTPLEIDAVVSTCATSRSVSCAVAKYSIVEKSDISGRCADNVRKLTGE